jgi:hypothetical protein
MADSLRDKIILGHNAFFGVDHLSSARGAQRGAYFADPKRIIDVINDARSLGAGGFMMSTHERALAVAGLVKEDRELKQNMRLYLLLPYAQKYVVAANEVGMINAVMNALSGTTMSQKLAMFWKGGKGVLAKDINSILSAMIRLELAPFQELNLSVVFLHDVFADLLLGLGLPDVFQFYVEEIHKTHGCQGGFATKNLPVLLERFNEWGLPEPVVMTHFNKIGYHMNPSVEACEAAARKYNVSILAMGTLASGYLQPDEAYRYIGDIPNIESVVVGVSSREHAEETFAAIRRYLLTPEPAKD